MIPHRAIPFALVFALKSCESTKDSQFFRDNLRVKKTLSENPCVFRGPLMSTETLLDFFASDCVVVLFGAKEAFR